MQEDQEDLLIKPKSQKCLAISRKWEQEIFHITRIYVVNNEKDSTLAY